MNFYWVCSSINFNYSDVIQNCFLDPTTYINVHEEENLHKDALKIVLESKLKLEKLYANQEEEIKHNIRKSQFGNITNIDLILENNANPYKEYENFIDEKSMLNDTNYEAIEIKGKIKKLISFFLFI